MSDHLTELAHELDPQPEPDELLEWMTLAELDSLVEELRRTDDVEEATSSRLYVDIMDRASARKTAWEGAGRDARDWHREEARSRTHDHRR